MNASRPITIVGGGLAGLALGIGLRQRDVPVSVWEAGDYPRHRVCGEFISGNGPAVLDRLGLRRQFDRAGAVLARTARFLAGPNQTPVRRLPAPALCLSRHSLDALLAAEFERLGGDLRRRSRWQGALSGDGVVRASGRRPLATERGWRWFGVKAHARDDGGVPLTADLEMHVLPDAYVGINRIEKGRVNVCGLFRVRPGQTGGRSPEQLLRGQPGSTLRGRLGEASFVPETFCSVGGLSWRARACAGECCIGDALGMIPPVTGNGMSIALESAELALDPLTGYSQGMLAWAEARQAVIDGCARAFRRRFGWARFLQGLMFSPLPRVRPGGVLLQWRWLWELLLAKTR